MLWNCWLQILSTTSSESNDTKQKPMRKWKCQYWYKRPSYKLEKKLFGWTACKQRNKAPDLWYYAPNYQVWDLLYNCLFLATDDGSMHKVSKAHQTGFSQCNMKEIYVMCNIPSRTCLLLQPYSTWEIYVIVLIRHASFLPLLLLELCSVTYSISRTWQ